MRLTNAQIKQLSDAHNISESMVYHVYRRWKKTTVLGLALDLATITGAKPLNYVTEKYRSLALAAHPELAHRV